MSQNKCVKYSQCPWCDYNGLLTTEQRCDHMKKHHNSNVMMILETVAPYRINGLKVRGVDPYCWAAGMASKSGFGFFSGKIREAGRLG